MTGAASGLWMCQLDRPTLVRALRKVAGRRFLGVIEVYDCIELVFDDGEPGGNLVTVYTEGRPAGHVALGGVADPDEYVLAYEASLRWESAS
jgi:hypothetical protein